MFKKKPAHPKILPTYLAASSEFQGTLHVEGNLLVDGIVHGTVEVRGDMEISENGLVEGPEVRARNLVVHGVLKARVLVDGKLTLTNTARLEGDVVASALGIEPGAFYVGYIETKDASRTLPGTVGMPELASGKEEYR
ncbi:MAG: polymer-forming cytoskeletal protein [Scytolyngbya sp. HA4215-MV1]|jgi:cytoskeletal protein CcmA (bactofilin family)|nr:polymer-forming cytoskeletal protein [Scytolyngbya sp. HA4215-MV1]